MNVNWEVKILIEEKKKLESSSEIDRFVKNLNKAKYKKCSDIDLNSFKGSLDWIFNEDRNSEEKIDKYADCINYIVGNTKTCSNSKVSDAVERWLSCLDQIFFKKRQPLHYEKHKGIAAVMILPEGKEDTKYKFNILVLEAQCQENKNNVEKRKKKLEKVICEDIISEYEEVKSILNQYIELKFSYQLYNVQCFVIFKNYNDYLDCKNSE
jgi:hypothetical protein